MFKTKAKLMWNNPIARAIFRMLNEPWKPSISNGSIGIRFPKNEPKKAPKIIEEIAEVPKIAVPLLNFSLKCKCKPITASKSKRP